MTRERSSPLAYPAFLVLWLAAIVTFLGSFVQGVGEQWVMMDLTRSPLPVALLPTAFTGASLLALLPGGILADRYDRRRVAIASQIIQTIAALAMALLAYTHHITPGALLGGVAVIGLGMALGSPAWSSLVPDVLPIALVPEGVALNAVAFNLARAFGPAVGGIVLARLGAAASFSLNAASFVVVIFALLTFRSHTKPQAAHSVRPIAGTFAEPWSLVRRPGEIRLVFTAMVPFTLGAGAFYALTPAFGKESLGVTPFAYGVMIGAMGGGAVLGASIVKRLRPHFSPRAVISGTMITFAFAIALVARASTLPAAMVLLVPAGVGWLGTFSSLQALVQVWAPDRLRARVIALYQMVHLATWAAASTLGGALANHFGIRAAMTFGAVVCFAGGLSTWRSGLPRTFVGVSSLVP